MLSAGASPYHVQGRFFRLPSSRGATNLSALRLAFQWQRVFRGQQRFAVGGSRDPPDCALGVLTFPHLATPPPSTVLRLPASNSVAECGRGRDRDGCAKEGSCLDLLCGPNRRRTPAWSRIFAERKLAHILLFED